MKISVIYTYRTRIDLTLAINKVWNIEDRELNRIGQDHLNLLNDGIELKEQFYNIALGSQCLIELLDLLPLILPKKGQFLNSNYLYCEGLSVFREAILAGLNGLFHSSFSSFRSALELFIYHVWWQKELRNSDDYSAYNDWLFGKERSQVKFSSVYSKVYNSFSIPKSASDRTKFREIYIKLCSYAHKPILKESITSIKQTNEPDANAKVLDYWAKVTKSVLEVIIDLMVIYKPQALFPQDIWKKYGFNIPVGLYFDKSNYVPFEAWFGARKIDDFKEHFIIRDDLVALIDALNKRELLSNDAIIASWTGSGEEEVDDLPSDNYETKILRRWAIMKARLRGTTMILSYMNTPHNIVWNDSGAVVVVVEL